MKKEPKWTGLNPKKHGMGGVVMGKLVYRKQDKKFKPLELYAVVFFPKLKQLGAAAFWRDNTNTLSQTPEAAISKFMDRICQTQTWEGYKKAGHKVRKIKITDLGDA